MHFLLQIYVGLLTITNAIASRVFEIFCEYHVAGERVRIITKYHLLGV